MPTRIDAAELSRRLLALMDKVSSRAAVEDVHRLRTTVRRLEVRLGDGTPGKIAKSLKTLRRKAGKVRDIDVHLGLLNSPLLVPASGRRQPETKAKRQTGSAKELAGQRKLRKILQASRIRPLASLRKSVARVEPLLRDRLPALAGREQAPQLSTARARQQVDRVRLQYLEAARELPSDAAALHALRIEAKKLRYAVEPLSGCPEAAAMVTQLKQVQDAIGQWHDWATLEQLARESLDSVAAAPLLAALHTRCGREYRRARRTAQRVRDRMNPPSRPVASAPGPHLAPTSMRRAG